MSLDGAHSNESLPFNVKDFNKTVESAGTVVHLPAIPEIAVVKVDKYPTKSNPDESKRLEQALNNVKEYRARETIAINMARGLTKTAIVPQEYVLADAGNGNTKTIRVQEFIDGEPLKKLGFMGVMNLDEKDTKTLKSILIDSMRCYLKYGLNFDLVGSDERDAFKSKTLYLKRLIFPLRNSSNLLKSESGIRLIDPNVYGNPRGNQNLKESTQQFLLFLSSAADYVLLSMRQLSLKFTTKKIA